jgi:hypothetical protein
MKQIWAIFKSLVIEQPCPGEIKWSPMLKNPIHLQTPKLKKPTRKFGFKTKLYKF